VRRIFIQSLPGWLYPRQALVAFDQYSAKTERVHPSGAIGLGELTDRGELDFMELPRLRTPPEPGRLGSVPLV